MGFVDVLVRNKFDIRSNGIFIIAKRDRQIYKYLMVPFQEELIDIYDNRSVGKSRTIVYCNDHEIVYDVTETIDAEDIEIMNRRTLNPIYKHSSNKSRPILI